jgi:hypothetical protein
MRRALAVGLVALGVAAVVALLASSSERRRGSSAPFEGHDPASMSSDVIESQAPSTPDRREVPSEGPVTEVPVPDERKMDITGNVVVVDEDLREHPSEDGAISITLWTGESGKPCGKIAVVDGKFHARVTEAATLEVEWLSLAGREAWVDAKRTPIPDDHVIEIRARWPRPTSLRVIDGETRADLSGLTLVKGEGDPDLKHPGDYEKDDILVKDGRSPLSVQPWSEPFASWNAVLYVSAPGYAWARAAVDFAAGGERLVELHRGAELELTLENCQGSRPTEEDVEALVTQWMAEFDETPASDFADGKPDRQEMRASLRDWAKQEALSSSRCPVVRLHVREAFDVEDRLAELAELVKRSPEGERPSLDELRASLEDALANPRPDGRVALEVLPVAGAPTLLSGVMPGSYVVAVEIGDWWASPIVLAFAPVTLVAGEKTSLTLKLADPPAPPTLAPLAGTLYLPPAWGEVRPTLRFQILNRPELDGDDGPTVSSPDLRPVEGSPGLYRWDAGQVPAGLWEVTIDRFGFGQQITVPEEGEPNARIVIGEPADLAVHLVDAESGLEAQVEAGSLSWRCASPEVSGGAEDATYDPSTHAFQLRAPAGEVELNLWERRYRWQTQRVTLRPGPNEVTLRLQRACGIVLTLRDGDAAVSPDEAFSGLELTRAGGSRELPESSGYDGKEVYFVVGSPGRFRVMIPSIDGYDPIEPFEVDIGPGELVKREIPLVRKRVR